MRDDEEGDDEIRPGRRAADYEVGYGKPPREHQFKPGESGRQRAGTGKKRRRGRSGPRRRARGQATVAVSLGDMLQEAVQRKVRVTQNGRTEKKVLSEVLVERWLAAIVAGGKPNDMLKALQLLEAHNALGKRPQTVPELYASLTREEFANVADIRRRLAAITSEADFADDDGAV